MLFQRSRRQRACLPIAEQLCDARAYLYLLLLDPAVRVDRYQPLALQHRLVLLDYPALKDPIALVRVVREVHVHPRLVVLELRPPCEDPGDRDVHGDPEVERNVGLGGVAVYLPDPGRVAAADDVPRVGGEDVPVGQDEIPGLEERQDVPLVPVGEVRGVEEAERGGRQKALLLSPRGYLLDCLRRVPLCLEDLEVTVPEPLLEEV